MEQVHIVVEDVVKMCTVFYRGILETARIVTFVAVAP